MGLASKTTIYNHTHFNVNQYGALVILLVPNPFWQLVIFQICIDVPKTFTILILKDLTLMIQGVFKINCVSRIQIFGTYYLGAQINSHKNKNLFFKLHVISYLNVKQHKVIFLRFHSSVKQCLNIGKASLQLNPRLLCLQKHGNITQ